MDPSILFQHAQRGTLAKKSKFNSLIVNWHSCFHLPQGHSTQPQMRHHVCVILDTNCPNLFWNTFITSIHGLVYFNQNTKQIFKEFLKTKDAILYVWPQWTTLKLGAISPHLLVDQPTIFMVALANLWSELVNKIIKKSHGTTGKWPWICPQWGGGWMRELY